MSKYRISIASPPDREKLVAMIDINHEKWAEVNQESGKLEIELYPRRDGNPWLLDLDDALNALTLARDRLLASCS